MFCSIIRSGRSHLTSCYAHVSRPGTALPKSITNLLHTLLFLGKAGLLSVYKYMAHCCLSTSLSRSSRCLTVSGVHGKDIFTVTTVFLLKGNTDSAWQERLSSWITAFVFRGISGFWPGVSDRPHEKLSILKKTWKIADVCGLLVYHISVSLTLFI